MKKWHTILYLPLGKEAQGIGPRIRLLRLFRGLSYRQMATKCGCSHVLIRKYEIGQLIPDTGRLLKFCEVLEFPIAAFMAKNFRVEAND